MAAEFLLTLADPKQLSDLFNGPFLKGRREPRLIMVGRSNVGKSSLLNALLHMRLAQVSDKPGKTKAIHFYVWKEAAKVVADLPGYGYAQASKSDVEAWAKLIRAYLRAETMLERAVILLDARHGPTPKDEEAIRFFRDENVPVTFVFTKTDALKNQKEASKRKKEAAAALERLGYDPKGAHWVSSETKDGLTALSRDLCADLTSDKP